MKWWKENEPAFPRVAKSARILLTDRATESDVERNLFHAKHILSDLRASMSPDMFHIILFLYENRDLWVDLDPALIFG